jgi:hypothetical protein
MQVKEVVEARGSCLLLSFMYRTWNMIYLLDLRAASNQGMYPKRRRRVHDDQ